MSLMGRTDQLDHTGLIGLTGWTGQMGLMDRTDQVDQTGLIGLKLLGLVK